MSGSISWWLRGDMRLCEDVSSNVQLLTVCFWYEIVTFAWISRRRKDNCTRFSSFSIKFYPRFPRTNPGRIIVFFFWGILYRVPQVFPPEPGREQRSSEILSRIHVINTHGPAKFEGDLRFPSKDEGNHGLSCVSLVKTRPPEAPCPRNTMVFRMIRPISDRLKHVFSW